MEMSKKVEAKVKVKVEKGESSANSLVPSGSTSTST
jgi:hypothetical protein